MEKYFGRKVSCRIEAQEAGLSVDVSNLRVVFTVSKKRGENVANITIYNSDKNTQSAILHGAIVTLEGGYLNTSGLLYHGPIIEIKHGGDNVNRTITVVCRGGANDIKSGTKSYSSSKGASAIGVLRDLGGRVGVPFDIISPDKLEDKQYTGGWSFLGTPYAALKQVAARVGGEVVMLDGAVRIIPKGGATITTVEAPTYGRESGLIGFPTRIVDESTEEQVAKKKKKTMRGWDFETCLDSRPIISGLVVVRSEVIPGGSSTLTIEELTHEGDSEGSNWRTKIKGYEND